MQKVKIDFDNPGLPQHISAMESDNKSRFFEVSLYKGGKIYAAPSGATYSLMYSGFGPQNQGWYDTINDSDGKRNACTVSGNVITCEIVRQALQVPGVVNFVLCVSGTNGYMLKSWPIQCDCQNDAYDSTTEVESFFYVTRISNASWTEAIQAWENLKTTLDTTLSVSGKAAEAKATGERIKEETDRAQQAEKNLANRIDKISVGGLTIGTVTSGSTASASITDGKLNLVLPKGDRGPAGSGAGISDTEKSLLLSLFAHTVYDDATMRSLYDKLHALWDVEIIEPTKPVIPVQSVTLDKTTLSLRVDKTATLTATVAPGNATDKTVTWSVVPAGYATVEEGKVTALKVGSCTVTAAAGGVSADCALTVIPEPSSTSVPGETPVYKLAAPRTFATGQKQYIDTGIKMFESIDPKPDWTILFEVQGGENCAPSQALMHCMDETEPWPGFTAHTVNGGYFQANIYGGKASLATMELLKASKARYAIRISGSKATRWLGDVSTQEVDITNYNTAVSQSLLLGCYQESDGTKGRFWDGTLYQCMVFHKALTDEQVETWLTT